MSLCQLFALVALLGFVAAFALRPVRPWGAHLWNSTLVHTGMHTEHGGPGRVWFVSFFGGVGCVRRIIDGRGWDGKPLDAPGWRPNVYIPGFTLYVRLTPSRHPTCFGAGPAVRRVRLTRKWQAVV